MTYQIAVGAVLRNEAGITAALPELAARFGTRFSTSADIRRQHAATTTWLETQPPDAVVFVESAAEVAEIVTLCAAHRVPVIPFGVGTSLEGHVNAPAGGVSIDFGRMNRVLAVHAEDLDCVVEPGVTRKQLIITSLTLRLYGIPEAIAGGVCGFPSVEAACNATILTIQSGIPVARIELLDTMMIRATNLYSRLSLAEGPTLFVEFHGTEASVAEQSERFGEIAREFGGGDFAWTAKPEERTRLWQARHDAYWAGSVLRPGAKGFTTDVCVPLSRLAECVRDTEADVAATGLVTTMVGHVGDGNFHVNILVDMEDAGEVERAAAFTSRLNRRALDMDGTCTGEHGVGQGKAKYLAEELPEALIVMRKIKQALDPLGILNPGKILLPDDSNSRG